MSTTIDPFVKPAHEYQRQLNPLKAYHRQMSFYLHRMTGRPIELCKTFTRDKVKSVLRGPNQLTNDIIIKDKNGDRVEHQETMNSFIRRINDDDLLLTPSLAGYVQPQQQKSLIADIIDVGLANRKLYKHKMFEAKKEKDDVNVPYYSKMQTGAKIDNNSWSGVQAVEGTALFNPSAHPSLTSICRLITSHGNLNNERMVAGNRYYRTAEIAMADLVLLAEYASHHSEQIYKVMEDYSLYAPDTPAVMQMVSRCSRDYWNDAPELERMSNFLDRCTPAERAYILYCGDLYHLAKYNDDAIRHFFNNFCLEPRAFEGDYSDFLKTCNSDVQALAMLLQSDLVGQAGLAKLKERSDKDYRIVVGQMNVIMKNLYDHTDLIETFLRPPYLPCNLSEIEHMVRDAVVLSDTDSSVVTMQEWSMWYYRTDDFSKIENRAWFVMTFILTQTLRHTLHQISANVGIKADRLHVFEMKNEFGFPSLMLSVLSKHYFAGKLIQEGVFMEKMDYEVKGVNLRSSNLPPVILERFNRFMRFITDSISDGCKLSASKLIGEVVEIERMIDRESRNGSDVYLRTSDSKDADSYTRKEDEPKVKQHRMWQEIFAAKYGDAPEFPYRALTLPLNLNGKTRYLSWIDGLADRQIADKLKVDALENGRDKLPRFRVPHAITQQVGIPEEFRDVLDLRGTIRAAIAPFYLALQILGLYLLDEDGKLLLSDQIKPD